MLLAAPRSALGNRSRSWRRAEALGRGVNLSRWRAPLGPASAEGEGPEVLAGVAALGFRHVRLPVDPEAAVAALRESEETAKQLAAVLARQVAAAHGAGLGVILDLHPPDAFRDQLARDPAERARFLRLWEILAAGLASLDPDRLLLELLNEPGEALGAGWAPLQRELVRRLRAVAPEHTLLCTGALWSTIGDLRALAPLPDPDIAYAVHFYAPMMFTHQGADWGAAAHARLRGVPYPLTRPRMEALAAAAPPADRAVLREDAAAGDWDAAAIGRALAEAGRWAARHGAPVLCTEFGAFRDGGAPRADRLRYLSDVRQALERHLQAWTVWDYSGGFGVLEAAPPHRPDGATLRALGLVG
jgi:hypothetical protein